MATRNQVLSLFGATPQQVMERQRQQQAEFLASQRDGFQQSGAAIGLGLARLFGGKTPEMEAAEQMQAAIAGVDPNDPAALRELAQTVSSFAPERALQIAAYAGELEKSQMPATIDVPTIVGYETEPDIDPTTGLQRLDADKNPMFKRNPVYRNVPFERTPEGLRSLVPGYSLPTGASAAVKDDLDTPATTDAPVPDYITNEQGVVVRNPNKTATATTQAQASTQPVTSSVSPEAAERIGMQSGESRGARTGETGVGVRMPPAIQGEMIYADPEALTEASNAIRDQITKLENSKDKDKAAKIKALKKRRAEIQKLRIQSRRSGAPADLRATGKDSDVLSGFRNVK
jgi:hypothetical protein